MASPKKTIKIQELKEWANEQLASTAFTYDVKLGIIAMIEKALRMADAYNGYMFINLQNGEAPMLDDDGWVCRKYF